MLKVMEKHFNTEYKLEVILLDVKAAVDFKFKLQLKFGINKNYCSIIDVDAVPYSTLQLKFRSNKHFHEERLFTGIVSHMVLKLHKQSFIDVTSFRLSKSLHSLSVLFKRTNNFGSVFTNVWIVEFTEQNSRHTQQAFFSIRY
jgi:hypothetical protein